MTSLFNDTSGPCSRASNTNPTAHAPNSDEYFLPADMIRSFRGNKPTTKPEAVQFVELQCRMFVGNGLVYLSLFPVFVGGVFYCGDKRDAVRRLWLGCVVCLFCFEWGALVASSLLSFQRLKPVDAAGVVDGSGVARRAAVVSGVVGQAAGVPSVSARRGVVVVVSGCVGVARGSVLFWRVVGVLLGLVVSGLVWLLGFVVVPGVLRVVLSGGVSGGVFGVVGWGLLGVGCVVLSCLLLLCLVVWVSGGEAPAGGVLLTRLVGFVGVWFGVVVVVALVVGVVSVLVFVGFGSWLGVVGVAGVVDGLVLGVSLLLAPVLVVAGVETLRGVVSWRGLVALVCRLYVRVGLWVWLLAAAWFGVGVLLPNVSPVVGSVLGVLLGGCVLVRVVGVVCGARRGVVGPAWLVSSGWVTGWFGGFVSGYRRVLSLVLSFVLGLSVVVVGPSEAYADDDVVSPSPVVPAVPVVSTVLPSGDVDGSGVLLREPVVALVDEPVGVLVDAGDGWVTYSTGERSFSTVVGGSGRAFRDEGGVLRVTDDTLVPVMGGLGAGFVNASADFSLFIPVLVDDVHPIRLVFGEAWVELVPVGGDFSRPVAKANAVLFNDVWPGVDVQYSLIGGLFKEDIILNRFTDMNRFETRVRVSEGVALVSVPGGLEVHGPSRGASEADFDASDDVVVFSLSAPDVSDAVGGFIAPFVDVFLVSADVALFSVGVDAGWLADPVRVFPVVVDPSVSVASPVLVVARVETGLSGEYSSWVFGDDGFAYVGFDTNYSYGFTRTYVGVDYDFAGVFHEGVIDSASLRMYQYQEWDAGGSEFVAYRVGQPWSVSSLSWDNQPVDHTAYSSVFALPGRYVTGWVEWDVRDIVSEWANGVYPNYGLVLKAVDERNMTSAVFRGGGRANQPELVITWHIPDPVDPGTSGVSVVLRAVTEKNADGLQRLDGVFGDGVTRPDAVVSYELVGVARTGSTVASRSYKYPDSSGFEAMFPNGTRYADKLSNWQTGLFTSLPADTLLSVTVDAALDGWSASGVSDTFLVYRVQARDTLPFIAAHYGVSLNVLMADNRVQDTLAVDGNTLFIRNPSTTQAYNTSSSLSEAQMRQIDSALMGRGKHCEYGFEPINLSTGDFWLEAVDVSIPDLDGGFTLTRSYNSLGSPARSLFGFGWEFEYSQSLVRTPDGGLAYTSPDGKTLGFTKNLDGSYSSPIGFGLRISEVYTSRSDGSVSTSFRMVSDTGRVSLFDSWGLLVSVTDARGLVTTLDYDADLRLSSVTSPSGLRFSFTIDGQGRVSGVTRPDGVQLRYGYDAAGDLVEFTDGNGETLSYSYDAQHRMVSWTDQNSIRVVLNSYDALGRVTRQVDANGGVATLTYTPTATVSTDPLGNVTTYTYDSSHRVTGVTYPDGEMVTRTYGVNNTLSSDEYGTYTYDAHSNRLSFTDLDGATTIYTYDTFDRVTSVTDPDGYMTSMTYSPAGDLVNVTYPDGGQQVSVYDSLHRLVSVTDANANTETYTYTGASAWPTRFTDATGGVFTYTYTRLGSVASVMDPAGGVTRYMYDNAGNQVGTQTPDGAYTRYILDRAGNPVQVIDPNGALTKITYDSMRNIVVFTDPNGGVTRYAFDGNSNQVSVTNQLGGLTEYSYDSRDRLISVTDPNGGSEVYEWNDLDLMTRSVDAAGGVTAFTYTPAGLQLSVTDPAGAVTGFTYSPAGRPLTSTNPLGGVTNYTYGPSGDVVEVSEPSGLVTSMEYDRAGNVTRLVQSGTGVDTREYAYSFDAANRLVSSTDPLGGATAYTYDYLGDLLSVTDPLGQITSYSYDPSGRPVSSTDPLGAVTLFTYDPAGNLVSTTDANGNVSTLVYDGMSHLIGVEDATGAVTVYGYDLFEQQTSVTDPYGAVTSYVYDPVGNLVSVTDPLGRVNTLTYDTASRLVSVTDPAGYSTIYAYDAVSRVNQVTYPNGLVVDYTFDTAGNTVRVASSDGRSETYSFDTSNRQTAASDPAGRSATWVYDPYSQLVEATGFDGITTSYAYDALGRLISETIPGRGTTSYIYNPVGVLTSVTDPLGALTSYTYDTASRLVSVTDPLGAVTSYTYDRQGNLTELVDALGGVTAYVYDVLNRPVGVSDANTHTTSYTYDALSRLTQVTRPAGDTTSYVYDLAGQLIASTDPLGGVTGYTYDPRGLLTSLTDPLGGVTASTWDSMGQLASSIDPLGRVTSYDYSLSTVLIRMVDPAGSEYAYTYDDLDRLTSVTSPLGLVHDFTYDTRGNIVSENDNLGRKSTYTWDELHNMVSVTNPTGGVSKYTYDPLGRLLTEQDPLSATTRYTYDANAQLTKIIDPLDGVTTYTYDLLGRVRTVTDPVGDVNSYAYDPVGNLTESVSGYGRSTLFSYDGNDRLVEVSNPLGALTRYTYDAADRLINVTQPTGGVTGYGYDPVGNLTSILDPAGLATMYTYDPAGQLASVVDGLGNKTSYAYDPLGNVTRVTDANSGVTSYSYDAESNLTSVTSPAGVVEEWLYDPASRLTGTLRPGGGTRTYDYDALNQLVAIDYSDTDDAVSYLYDSAGRRTSMTDPTGDSTYTYDALGRLVSVTQGDGSSIEYTYTPDSQFESITYPDGTQVTYTYDEDKNLVSVTDQAGTSTYTYNAAGDPITLTRPTGAVTTYDYDEDQRVTSVTHTSDTGTLISEYQYVYDPAGRIATETQTIPSDGDTILVIERVFTYDEAARLVSYMETSTTQMVTTPASTTPTGEETSEEAVPGSSMGAPSLSDPAATVSVLESVTDLVAYSFDSVGNRVSATRSAADGVIIEKVTYTYDGDNRLVKEVSNITGTTTYSHDPAGLLIGSTGYRGDISYSYDADQRLAAVRSGGRLLMAATYNGDGDRIFQATAIPVTASVTAATGGVSDWLLDQLPDTAAGVFWYAFISTLAEGIAGSNGALMVGMQPGVRAALTTPSQALDPDIPLGTHDIETLTTAGIDLAEVTDWIDTIYATLIPGEIEVSADGWTYQLTHYVNNINTTHTQVLATYGAAGSSVTNYTYGLDRLNSTSTSVDWFLHDGRGSVGQTLTGTSVGYSASYDPWGAPNITMGATSTPHYGYNGEDYNPVTGLQFLRARYYQSATGVFTQPDTYLGDPSDPATLHRYAYCVTDPLNYRDPSGHSMTGDWGPSPSKPKAMTGRSVGSGKSDGNVAAQPLVKTWERDVVSQLGGLATQLRSSSGSTAVALQNQMLQMVGSADSKWVEQQLTSLGFQVNRTICVDAAYMTGTGTSGSSDETIASLFPNGEIRVFTNVSLVRLPPKYHSDVSYDATLGLGETVGDMSWGAAPIMHVGYYTLEEQQAARQFFGGIALSPVVAAGCGLSAPACIAAAGGSALVNYTVSTESVGLQVDSATAAQQMGVAMVAAGAGIAASKLVSGTPTTAKSNTNTGSSNASSAGSTSVVADDVPVAVFSRGKAPGIADNFDQALLDGQPTVLMRVTSAEQKINRRAAQRGQDPAPGGMSIEEYPFACTAQGGCGATTSIVPLSEQHYQGGVLSAFFRKNQVGVGDNFAVVYGP